MAREAVLVNMNWTKNGKRIELELMVASEDSERKFVYVTLDPDQATQLLSGEVVSTYGEVRW